MLRYFPKECEWLIEPGQKAGNCAICAWSCRIAAWLNLVVNTYRCRRVFRHRFALSCRIGRRTCGIAVHLETIDFELEMQQRSQKHACEIILDPPMTLCDHF